MISVKNISYRIAQQRILDDINALFDAGKISAILGPNGAGKSTLLQCLTGALKPDYGCVTLDGRNLEAYSLVDLSKKRAVLSQSITVSFPFTALEIVLMGRSPFTLNNNSSVDNEIAHETLDLMDAWHLKDRSFPTLSGGEQQRVQFARVLSQIWDQKNAYLFLDEPTSALDLKHQYKVMEIIQNQCVEKFLTVIIVMHDLNIAYQNTDTSYFIKNGQVQVFGASKDVICSDILSDIYDLPLSYAAQHVNYGRNSSHV